jgi:prepilin-type N-terminal cleavage/methylation domain-containing protein
MAPRFDSTLHFVPPSQQPVPHAIDAETRSHGDTVIASQPATRNQQPATSTQHSALSNLSPRAFTLVEMLVVITVIVLAMTLAIPAIRSLTGSRSQESAQNTLTAVLGTARADAMALQRIEGIMFFLDTTSDRIKCAEVMETSFNPLTDAQLGEQVVYLDLVPDRDPLLLPAGIWLWTIKDAKKVPFQDPFDTYRYLGFNSYFGATTADGSSLNPPLTNIPGGVILFDSTGRLTSRRYGFRNAKVSGSSPPSLLGLSLYEGVPNNDKQSLQDWPSAAASNFYIDSQIGICLFDRETFLAQTSSGSQNFTANNLAANAVAINKWLDANTTPMFVNRYDATLMRAE